MRVEEGKDKMDSDRRRRHLDESARLIATHGRSEGARRLDDMLAMGGLHVIEAGNGRHIVTRAEHSVHLGIMAEAARRATSSARWQGSITTPGLTREQRDAAGGMLRSLLSIVTGAPGTGKSTTIAAAAAAMRTAGETGRIVVAAFSARVAIATARRASIEGMTLHALTKTRPGADIGSGDPLDRHIAMLFIDEAFAVEPAMIMRVLRLAAWTTRIALVGDPDQMPPIGTGRCVHDMLECGLAPHWRLTVPHRLAGSNHLRRQIQRVGEGHVPIPGRGLRIVTTTDENGGGKAKAMMAAKLVSGSMNAGRSCIALTTTRHGFCGHVAINRLITGTALPRRGDELITIERDPGGRWKNGERATVIDTAGDSMEIEFEDARRLWVDRKDARIALGYAMSGHRAQGLEYDRGVLVLDNAGRHLLSRQYLVSALSRAPDMVVLTSPGLLRMAVARDEIATRAPTLKAIRRSGRFGKSSP